MCSVLKAALDLSTSTKPFDSVTAAHLLSLLLHQPDLSHALLHCAREHGLDFQPSSPPSRASESLILEYNTLAGEVQMQSPNKQMWVLNVHSVDMLKHALTCLSSVVQYLLRCLQSEVLRAETSLLQAAASYPLYGRAHCITAVLQHLNTE